MNLEDFDSLNMRRVAEDGSLQVISLFIFCLFLTKK